MLDNPLEPLPSEQLYTVTELAAELDVTPRTIRFYEAKGLVKPQRVGARRIFSRRDRARLILILRGKRLGFRLREIKEYLDLYDADPTQTTQTAALLKAVRARIFRLQEQRKALEQTLTELIEIEQQAVAALAAHSPAVKR
ncbi:MAG: MerR family DNA-binding transcriptional regulator [Acidobacteriia bacterium]|nr:MerR family DNA-binding transcriptional regulator [Methyloceanibacter sp.]MBX5470910.1 MerR family DNA-binding transcriptional regulator [Acetobacteraceae bacterium]MCL6490774.1 MerR family DNA-binding transcriptional regulator [Terriglobia bacterium]